MIWLAVLAVVVVLLGVVAGWRRVERSRLAVPVRRRQVRGRPQWVTDPQSVGADLAALGVAAALAEAGHPRNVERHAARDFGSAGTDFDDSADVAAFTPGGGDFGGGGASGDWSDAGGSDSDGGGDGGGGDGGGD